MEKTCLNVLIDCESLIWRFPQAKELRGLFQTLQHWWHVCLGHGELEAGADVSDHDEGSGGAQEVEGGVVDVQKLEGVHHHRGRDQGQHREVELTPSGSEQYQYK